eukprot:gene3994-4544_t
MPGGYVKRMLLVKWNDMELVYSTPREELLNEDFKHGIKMMQEFEGFKHIVQLVGYCYKPLQIVTKYYKFGSANNLNSIIKGLGMNDLEEFKIRLQLAEDYLVIISFLHNSPIGCRVMCDSNSLNKTMSQFIISNDFHLLLSDLDALPMVNKGSNREQIKCGHKQLFGTFVAPEQLWPYRDKGFDDNEMPGYDEKTDIWKVPDIIFYLLGNTLIGEQLKFILFDLLRKCKNVAPAQRPGAKEILHRFLAYKEDIMNDLEGLNIKEEL